MYCSDCRHRLFYKDLDSRGWCDKCNGVVDVSLDKVSSWTLITTFALAWFCVVS